MSDEPKISWKERIQKSFDLKLIALMQPYFKLYKWLLSFCIIAMLAADILAVSIPMLFEHAVDEYIIPKNLEGLASLVNIMILIVIVSFIMRFTANFSIAFFGQKLLYELRLKVFNKALALSNDYYDRVSTGTTLTHITNDVESVRQFVSSGVVSVFSSLTKVICILVAMLYINFWLGLVTIICIPIFAIATYWFKGRIREGFRGVRKANSEINTQMVESLNGFRELTLFQNRQASIERFDKNNVEYRDSYNDVVYAYAIYLPLIETITHISTLIILVISHFSMETSVSTGQIFAFFTLINMFFRPLREIAEQFNIFQSAMAALERIKIINDEKVSVESDIKNDSTLNKTQAREITFNDVQFHYKVDSPILKSTNLSIRAKEKIALVGSTGAGKSTIIHLLNRLYDIQDGSIQIGGNDIQSYSLEDLRGMIATIPQDVFMFTGSILDNIRLFDERITLEQVQDTINQLELSEFINGLPKGLDTYVQEGGSALSNGEKQLIAFARAFVKNPGILIFDEATANVDSITEKRIETALKILLENRTSIIIAHRLSTIQSVDRIFYLQHGQVLESGTHEELYQLNGHYRKLYDMQAIALSY